jgi:hypothetical protein
MYISFYFSKYLNTKRIGLKFWINMQMNTYVFSLLALSSRDIKKAFKILQFFRKPQNVAFLQLDNTHAAFEYFPMALQLIGVNLFLHYHHTCRSYIDIASTRARFRNPMSHFYHMNTRTATATVWHYAIQQYQCEFTYTVTQTSFAAIL